MGDPYGKVDLLEEASAIVAGKTPPGGCNNQDKGCCGYCTPCGTRINQAIDRLFPLLVAFAKEEHRRVLELLEDCDSLAEEIDNLREDLDVSYSESDQGRESLEY